MTITSTFVLGLVQANGKTSVIEHHVSDLYPEKPFTREYEAFVDPAHAEYTNPALVLQLRNERLNKEEAASERAIALAAGGRFSLSKYEWRKRFTAAEQDLIDPFNEGGYESHPGLSSTQRTDIKRQMRNYAAASTIEPTNADVIAVVNLYIALGFITSARGTEILNG